MLSNLTKKPTFSIEHKINLFIYFKIFAKFGVEKKNTLKNNLNTKIFISFSSNRFFFLLMHFGLIPKIKHFIESPR
ncbi:hypothetical protein BpHYR1_017840 [Brachionus plicatilis]|uniref:Uncharacterized protein n=1 Tax=Brachionus plicatilis TaxID=10195 RepID=A0A3M7QVF5_BRAPC|nr:hypothetical protein BpHYR1_017840 [Brachionus plicatilis]